MSKITAKKDKYSFDKVNHIHFLNGRPLMGTTTILKVLSKPLTWWASALAVQKFGWLDPKKHTEEERREAAIKERDAIASLSIEDYSKFLDGAYRAHSDELKKAADKGTDLHGTVKDYIKSQLEETSFIKIGDVLDTFIAWRKENIKKFLFAETHCYSSRLWIGGIADFGYLDREGRFILADIKSSAEIYFDHVAQLGGYQIQIEENGPHDEFGKSIKLKTKKQIEGHAIFTFRGGFIKPSISYQVERNKNLFEKVLSVYKIKKDFDREKF